MLTSPSDWPTPPRDIVYRGIAGEFVHAAKPYTEADPIAVLVQYLTAFGNAVGPDSYTAVAGTVHTPRLFPAIVGSTSSGRKGDSWNMIRAMLRHITESDNLMDWRYDRASLKEWVKNHITKGLSTGEGVIYHLRDPKEEDEDEETGHGPTGNSKHKSKDTELMLDKRLLLIESEFGKVLRVAKRDGNTLEAIIRDAWDDRGDLAVMTKNNALVATGTHISIVGHITAEELTAELTDTSIANGFANRFMWVCVHRSQLIPNPLPFTGEITTCQANRFAAAVKLASEIGLVERNEAAAREWDTIYRELAEKEEPGIVGAILARSAPHITRLSLVYALLDGSPVITVEHQNAAVELWRYMERSVRFIFGDATGNPIADRILKELRTSGPLTRTEISGLFQRNQDKNKLVPALELLTGMGRIIEKEERTGGRPVTRYQAA